MGREGGCALGCDRATGNDAGRNFGGVGGVGSGLVKTTAREPIATHFTQTRLALLGANYGCEFVARGMSTNGFVDLENLLDRG